MKFFGKRLKLQNFLVEEFPTRIKMEGSIYSSYDNGGFKGMINITEKIGTYKGSCGLTVNRCVEGGSNDVVSGDSQVRAVLLKLFEDILPGGLFTIF